MDSEALADLIRGDLEAVLARAEILDLIDAARVVGAELAERHPELSEEERAEVITAIDGYIAELTEEDQQRRLAPGQLDVVLGDLESEGPDLR